MPGEVLGAPRVITGSSAPGNQFADPDHPVELRLLLETTRRRQA